MSTSRSWRVVAALLTLLASVFGVGFAAVPASAHTALLTGRASCTPTGWSVAWTISNDWRSAATVSDSGSEAVFGSAGQVVPKAKNSGKDGVLTVQIDYPTSRSEVTASEHVVWTDRFSQNVQSTVQRPENCGGDPGKVTICHRDNHDEQPYGPKAITVDQSAVLDHLANGEPGHLTHTGPVWTAGLKAHHVKWGDIIPPFGDFEGYNWNDAGQAIWNNDCQVPVSVSPAVPVVTQPVCVAGTVTEGSFQTPADSAGISYTSAGDVVTAKANKGYVLSGPADGWVGDGAQQTYTVHYVPATCPGTPQTVIPVAPQVTPAVCTDGELVPGSFALPTAPEGITYSSDGDLVIATANEGYVLGSAEGWTGDAQRQTFTVTYGGPTSCPTPPQTVTPVAPDVAPAVCTDGELVPGSFALPTVPEGITYSSDGDLVIATANEGYVLGSAEGWTGDAQRQTFTVTYGGPTSCPTPPQTVTPVAPGVVQPGCDGTTPYPGSISPVTTTGITYSVEGTTVTASATAGYVLGETAGWTGNAEVQTYKVTFNPAPNCGTTPTPPPVVINPSDLSLVKAVDKKQAQPGDVLTYSLTATVKAGADNGVEAQNGVTVKDVVPAGTSYVADSAECTTTTAPDREVECTPAYDPATSTVSATADDQLAVGDSLELTFQARIASPAVVDGKSLTTVDNTGLVQSGSVEGVSSNTVSTGITDVEGVIVEKPPVQKPPVQQPGSPAPGTVDQPATLPHTGADGSRLPLTGLLLLGLGLALVLAGRRRREHGA